MAVLQEKKMDATLEKDEILIRGEKNPTDGPQSDLCQRSDAILLQGG
jgi:hypothetical protein